MFKRSSWVAAAILMAASGMAFAGGNPPKQDHTCQGSRNCNTYNTVNNSTMNKGGDGGTGFGVGVGVGVGGAGGAGGNATGGNATVGPITNTNIAAGGAGGAGGKATIEKGAVQNTVKTDVNNTNVNLVSSTNKQNQAQQQGQQQGQFIKDSGNSSSSSNSAVKNSGNSKSNSSATGGSVSQSGNSAIKNSGNSSATGGSVDGSGNSSNNITINMQDAEAERARSQTELQIAAIQAESNERVAEIMSDVKIRNTPSVSGPPLVSSNDTCMGSVSGSVNVPGLGIGGGKTYIDENCVMLKNSRELWNMGMKAAALARMCMDAKNRDALEITGFVCPQTESARKTEAAALAKGEATITDPIVRRRLGLAPLAE